MQAISRGANDSDHCRAAALLPECDVDWVNSAVEERVLSPGEEVVPFLIADLKAGRSFKEKLGAHQFEMDISYCSVYGDCWMSSGTKTKPIAHLD